MKYRPRLATLLKKRDEKAARFSPVRALLTLANRSGEIEDTSHNRNLLEIPKDVSGRQALDLFEEQNRIALSSQRSIIFICTERIRLAREHMELMSRARLRRSLMENYQDRANASIEANREFSKYLYEQSWASAADLIRRSTQNEDDVMFDLTDAWTALEYWHMLEIEKPEMALPYRMPGQRLFRALAQNYKAQAESIVDHVDHKMEQVASRMRAVFLAQHAFSSETVKFVSRHYNFKVGPVLNDCASLAQTCDILHHDIGELVNRAQETLDDIDNRTLPVKPVAPRHVF